MLNDNTHRSCPILILPQGPGHFLVIHRWYGTIIAPHLSNLLRVDDTELARLLINPDDSILSNLQLEMMEQEFPQLQGGWNRTCPDKERRNESQLVQYMKQQCIGLLCQWGFVRGGGGGSVCLVGCYRVW